MAWKNVQYENGKYRTSEGGGGGGSSTLAGLDDVSFSNLQNGQVPKYNSNTQKWENANESGGGGTVTDVQVDGVSVVNGQGVAEIEMPTPPSVPDELSDLSDVQFNNLTDHQPLRYNATSQKWVNGADSFPPLIYSDEEREVGVWRDGRPLYQKTSVFTHSGFSGEKNLMPIDNTWRLIKAEVFAYNSSNRRTYFFPYISSAYDSIMVSDGYLKLVSNDSWNANYSPFYITVYYTKTTDTPGLGTWTTQGGYAHHYSTTEHVIGTWVDGKPLYEKTFIYDNVNISSGQTYLAGLTNISRLVKLEGTIHENAFFCVPYSNGTVSFGIIINGDGNFVTRGNDSWSNSDLTIVVRYTKTTD